MGGRGKEGGEGRDREVRDGKGRDRERGDGRNGKGRDRPAHFLVASAAYECSHYTAVVSALIILKVCYYLIIPKQKFLS